MSSWDMRLMSKTCFGSFYDRNRSRNRNPEQGYGSGPCWVKMIRFGRFRFRLRFRNTGQRHVHSDGHQVSRCQWGLKISAWKTDILSWRVHMFMICREGRPRLPIPRFKSRSHVSRTRTTAVYVQGGPGETSLCFFKNPLCLAQSKPVLWGRNFFVSALAPSAASTENITFFLIKHLHFGKFMDLEMNISFIQRSHGK